MPSAWRRRLVRRRGVGLFVGVAVGLFVGVEVGLVVGVAVGLVVGVAVGAGVGPARILVVTLAVQFNHEPPP